MKTIRHFERALGRKIVWYPRVTRTKGRQRGRGRAVAGATTSSGCGSIRTRCAMPTRTTTRTRRRCCSAISPRRTSTQGANYPGGLVFTCLSPDIVAHEMTHAILDSIHHRYIEDTNPDVAAFHEGFADIVALLQRFTFRRARRAPALRQPAGRIDQLYACSASWRRSSAKRCEGNRGALRSMIGRVERRRTSGCRSSRSPADYADNVEAHDRGAVLVATIFDAFQRIYTFRTRDLLRIATNGTGVLPEGSISRDLVAAPRRRSRRDRRAPAAHLHSRARLLPAERHHVRQLPARAHHRRPRHRAGGRERLPGRADRGVPRARHLPAPRQHAVDREPAAGRRRTSRRSRGEGARLHRARASSRTSRAARRDRRTGARLVRAIASQAQAKLHAAADGQAATYSAQPTGSSFSTSSGSRRGPSRSCSARTRRTSGSSRRHAGQPATSPASKSTRSARRFAADAKGGRSSRCSSR